MDISKIKLLSMMQANLTHLNKRQDVLSENIANANVPGFEAKDVKPLDFSDFLGAANSVKPVSVSTTNPAHIAGTINANNGVRSNTIKGGEVTPTGNTVVLENEVMKMSQNNMEYQQTTNMYRKMIEMIKTAIGNS